jgi:hypothetical protein
MALLSFDGRILQANEALRELLGADESWSATTLQALFVGEEDPRAA